jgi:hypothetical protein
MARRVSANGSISSEPGIGHNPHTGTRAQPSTPRIADAVRKPGRKRHASHSSRTASAGLVRAVLPTESSSSQAAAGSAMARPASLSDTSAACPWRMSRASRRISCSSCVPGVSAVTSSDVASIEERGVCAHPFGRGAFSSSTGEQWSSRCISRARALRALEHGVSSALALSTRAHAASRASFIPAASCVTERTSAPPRPAAGGGAKASLPQARRGDWSFGVDGSAFMTSRGGDRFESTGRRGSRGAPLACADSKAR